MSLPFRGIVVLGVAIVPDTEQLRHRWGWVQLETGLGFGVGDFVAKRGGRGSVHV